MSIWTKLIASAAVAAALVAAPAQAQEPMRIALVVKALGIEKLRVGPQIDPGVPWMVAEVRGAELAVALKSGNFGAVDFFDKALGMKS